MKRYVGIILIVAFVSCSQQNDDAYLEQENSNLTRQLDERDQVILRLEQNLIEQRERYTTLMTQFKEEQERNKVEPTYLDSELNIVGYYRLSDTTNRKIPSGLRIQFYGDGYWIETRELSDDVNEFVGQVPMASIYVSEGLNDTYEFIWYNFGSPMKSQGHGVAVFDVTATDFGFKGICYHDGDKSSSYEIDYIKVSDDPFFRPE